MGKFLKGTAIILCFFMIWGYLNPLTVTAGGSDEEYKNTTNSYYLVGLNDFQDPKMNDTAGAYDVDKLGALLNKENFSRSASVNKSNLDASKSEIISEGDKIKDKGPHDLFLLYMHSHGYKSDSWGKADFYFSPYDANGILESYVSGYDIISLLRKIDANKKVVIVESCHSGALIDDLMKNPSQDNSLLGYVVTGINYLSGKEETDSNKKYVVLTSCTADELSYFKTNYGGIFTDYLLEACEKKECDLDNDGWISVEEAFHYAQDKTIKYQRSRKIKQTPQMYDGNTREEVELVKL